MAKVLTIKKYPNRRLYNTDTKQYITMDELTQLIEQGVQVKVVDSKTNEDLTQQVLTQIILDLSKNQDQSLLTNEFLHQLIQYRHEAINDFFQVFIPRMFRSYLEWNQAAQNQMMDWASMGWANNPYNPQQFLTPFSMFNQMWSSTPQSPEKTTTHQDTTATKATPEEELMGLKQRLLDLEKRLNDPPKST